jgi:hypothetical protein
MRNMVRRRPAVMMAACTMLLAVCGSAGGVEAQFDHLYSRLSLTPPGGGSMIVCHGFGCRLRNAIEFSASDRAALRSMLAAGRGSPPSERTAVAKAVGWFDRRVGPVIGTSRRVARADFRNLDDDHNFDCTDTSTNTTSLLLLLSDWKLLRHHRVGVPRYRGNLLVGQTPHNTAVLVELKGGRAWSIDMWTTRYGRPAEVMPIEQWLEEN